MSVDYMTSCVDVLVAFLPERNNNSSVHKVSSYMRKGNTDSVPPYIWKKQLSRQSVPLCVSLQMMTSAALTIVPLCAFAADVNNN